MLQDNKAKVLQQLRNCISRGDLNMTDKVKVVGNGNYIGFYPVKNNVGGDKNGIVVSVAELLHKLESTTIRTR